MTPDIGLSLRARTFGETNPHKLMLTFSSLPWLGVFLAFAVYLLLGGLWFTLLFKRPYAYSLGKTPEALQNNAPIFIAGPAVCSLIITLTTAVLMQALDIATYGQALVFAVLVGLGYLVANTVNIAINPNMPRPLLYGFISGAFHLTGIILVALILVTLS